MLRRLGTNLGENVEVGGLSLGKGRAQDERHQVSSHFEPHRIITKIVAVQQPLFLFSAGSLSSYFFPAGVPIIRGGAENNFSGSGSTGIASSRNAMCISSVVMSPQLTVTDGSGLEELLTELSK